MVKLTLLTTYIAGDPWRVVTAVKPTLPGLAAARAKRSLPGGDRSWAMSGYWGGQSAPVHPGDSALWYLTMQVVRLVDEGHGVIEIGNLGHRCLDLSVAPMVETRDVPPPPLRILKLVDRHAQ